MPSRIDDKTTVPLSIVAVLFATGVSVTATGAFWVKSVNDRLSRIEDKLGIVQVPNDLITSAEAHTHGKGVKRGPDSQEE